MAIDPKSLTIDYKTLMNNTSISERVGLTKSSAGQQLLSSLSPTDLASAFPDYYKKNNPDVSGFIEATSRRYGKGKDKTPGTEFAQPAEPGSKTGPSNLGRQREGGRTSNTPTESQPTTISKLVNITNNNKYKEFLPSGGLSDAGIDKLLRMTGRMETGNFGSRNVSNDRDNSKSYGLLGLNTIGGSESSIQKFVKQNPGLGLTATPGTPEFKAQWQKLADSNPDVLKNAERTYYKDNILAGSQSRMKTAGIPESMTQDPRVIAYFADREIQQGIGSTNFGRTTKRIADALAISGNDSSKFLQEFTKIEATKQAMEADFPLALGLKGGPVVYGEKGHIGRLSQRLLNSGMMSTNDVLPSGDAQTATAALPPGISPVIINHYRSIPPEKRDDFAAQITKDVAQAGGVDKFNNTFDNKQKSLATEVSNIGTMGTNAKLHAAIMGGSTYLPEGYTLRQTSGLREGNNQSHHRHGNAGDYQIYDPEGNPIPNKGDDTTGMYTLLARGVKTWATNNDPDSLRKIGWGGAFGTKIGGGGVPDLMHFDFGGSRGNMRPDRQFHKLELLPPPPPKEATPPPAGTMAGAAAEADIPLRPGAPSGSQQPAGARTRGIKAPGPGQPEPSGTMAGAAAKVAPFAPGSQQPEQQQYQLNMPQLRKEAREKYGFLAPSDDKELDKKIHDTFFEKYRIKPDVRGRIQATPETYNEVSSEFETEFPNKRANDYINKIDRQSAIEQQPAAAVAAYGDEQTTSDQSNIKAFPIKDDLKSGNENTALVDMTPGKEPQMVTAMNSNESITSEPDKNKFGVTPEFKNRPDQLKSKEDDKTQKEAMQNFENAQERIQQTANNPPYSPMNIASQINDVVPTDHVLNSTMGRYVARTNFSEQGQHHSYGAANYKSNYG